MKNLIEIQDLQTSFHTSRGTVRAVEDVSFRVSPGEMVGVVGESGCGKSVTALSVMRLLPKSSGRIEKGRILWKGRDLASLKESEMVSIRGNRIGMIFQEPMTSLNPVLKVGSQIEEVLSLHAALSKKERKSKTIDLLKLVGIPDAERRVENYPHQMSGGMRQRVMIAMSIACNPELLIADEPTTALDVTVQAQILNLLTELQQKMGMGVIFITHNLGVVARLAHRVVVMYAGKIVETAPTNILFSSPGHPYTVGLLESIPRLERENEGTSLLSTIKGMVPPPTNYPQGCRFAPRCPFVFERCRNMQPPLLKMDGEHAVCCWLYHEDFSPPSLKEIKAAYAVEEKLERIASPREELIGISGISKHFSSPGRKNVKLTAVKNVTFSVHKGETFGIVGESGCGKTTLGKMIVGLEKPNSGGIRFKEEEIGHIERRKRKDLCRSIQMVFQDPFSSLNPRMTVREIIAQGLSIHGFPCSREKIAEILEEVGLRPEYMDRYPHQFSGGQRQRIGIARALAVNPEVVICDEPVSALDVSVQAQVINLLQRLQHKRNLTYLFIAHDLSVVRHIADRVMVMYLGQIMEIGLGDSIFKSPCHPYTKALLSTVLEVIPSRGDKKIEMELTGELPSPYSPPRGCPFSTRCNRKIPGLCDSNPPALQNIAEDHAISCWLYS